MILQALTRHYEDLLEKGEIEAPGWAPVKISYLLCLDAEGQVTQIVPHMKAVENGKKTVLRPQEETLPAPVKGHRAYVPIFCGTIPAICSA